MDFFTIDITEAATTQDIHQGEEVVIFGSQQSQRISIEEQAKTANTIPYELLTRCGNRVHRIFKGG